MSIAVNSEETGYSRQLLIGLDAMEWSLVRAWAEAGALPTFQCLLAQGARVELESTAAQLPDTVWSAIYSGMNPGHFAKYFYVQYDAATGRLKMMDDDSIGATPFWSYLTDAGRRVCVLDVPKFPVTRAPGAFAQNWPIAWPGSPLVPIMKPGSALPVIHEFVPGGLLGSHTQPAPEPSQDP